jgi:hypothetical protein
MVDSSRSKLGSIVTFWRLGVITLHGVHHIDTLPRFIYCITPYYAVLEIQYIGIQRLFILPTFHWWVHIIMCAILTQGMSQLDSCKLALQLLVEPGSAAFAIPRQSQE